MGFTPGRLYIFRLADHHLKDKSGYFAYTCGLLEQEYVTEGIPYLRLLNWWTGEPDEENTEEYNEHISVIKASITEFWDITPQGVGTRTSEELGFTSIIKQDTDEEEEEDDEEVVAEMPSVPNATPPDSNPPIPYIS